MCCDYSTSYECILIVAIAMIASKKYPTSKKALETSDLPDKSSSPMGSRHFLSKSASELSSPKDDELPSDVRPQSATSNRPSAFSVYQRTHSFFSQLKNKWTRCRSKDGRHKSPSRQDSATTDQTGEVSSDHSSPNRQSPRHNRLRGHRDSPLSRINDGDTPHSSTSGSPRRPPTPGLISGFDLIPLSTIEEVKRRKEQALRQHSFFQLRIHLKKGQELIAMDKSGTSDPYVKFKIGGRLVYKSKTVYRDLNPIWDELFTVPIEDPFVPLQIKVFDYDWGLQDDFMGSAVLELTNLDLCKTVDMSLPLQDPSRPTTNLGEILLSFTLYPKTQEDKDSYFQRNSKYQDVNRRLKSQIWSSVVTIVLIEGKSLLACDPESGTSDPYVKFRIANEKYKSKVIWRSLNPRWLEQFDLHLYDDLDQNLEITVWDRDSRSKDDFIGRCVIDLSRLEREKTHSLWQQLEEGTGSLHLLITISGTTASETISDLTSYEENPKERESLLRRYEIRRTFHNLRDVGHLTVKVYRATGLAAADLGGKSDPFCVLELGNARLQTQTEYKTLTPSWQKIFTFNVKDINNVLEVTVYDEDRDHKVEFLGKVAIPLLRIRNGEKRWYVLKDKKLRMRAKGNSPQILLELYVVWNPIRGMIRTINPKEDKFMLQEVKFKRQVFVQNVLRFKAIVLYFYEFGKLIQSCFEWDSTFQSFLALVFWLILCYYFEPWMLPAALLLIFFKNYVVKAISSTNQTTWSETYDSDIEEDEDDDKDKEEKKTLKERLQAIQEVTQTVQNTIGRLAGLGESVKNIFNFSVPYLSLIAVILLIGCSLVLYFIPARYLLMAWGTNKFLRRVFRPHSVPNNELLDLLSRVPDDEVLLDYRDLRPVVVTEPEKRKDTKKKQKVS